MAEVYRSTERVYTVDENGDPFSLLYAVGDEIPEAEARRQGLIPEEPEPKARTASNKARTAPNKTISEG